MNKIVKKIKQFIRIAQLCCVSMLLAGCDNQADFYVEQQEGINIEEDTEIEITDENVMDVEVEIYVQISGAVKNPGVYQLPSGSRVFEAVELAGGITENADFSSVNQAQILTDGQQIYIYAIGEAGKPEAGNESQTDGKVNLNTASMEQLMTLPGIGKSKAESIIAFREENGGFTAIEELMNITGIKEGVFNKIKDYIKIN